MLEVRAVRGQLVEQQHPLVADGKQLALAQRRHPALLDVRERAAGERDGRERDLREARLDERPGEAGDGRRGGRRSPSGRC